MGLRPLDAEENRPLKPEEIVKTRAGVEKIKPGEPTWGRGRGPFVVFLCKRR